MDERLWYDGGVIWLRECRDLHEECLDAAAVAPWFGARLRCGGHAGGLDAWRLRLGLEERRLAEG